MKQDRVLPWIGWDDGRAATMLLRENSFSRRAPAPVASSGDPFVDVTREWWDRLAAAEKWEAAAALGKSCAEKRATLSYGWENWAWGLHKQGQSEAAYDLLAPLLKKLKLPGPPSGRAAYCLACFCGALERKKEGTRWLRLAQTLAADKEAFRIQAVLEPDLREIWPSIPELNEDAHCILE